MFLITFIKNAHVGKNFVILHLTAAVAMHSKLETNTFIHYKQTHLQSFFLILNKFSAKIRVS
jgi:hypothetical protein